ncbi:MAG TPA: hypothetical protein VNM92_16550 [Thermoanaerobaculia bacterium]|nr:hypothetical protein [Thermoanaerobaculia bacterium]
MGSILSVFKISFLSLLLASSSSCTGEKSTASETARARQTDSRSAAPPPPADVRKQIEAIGSSIPFYAGARYSDELSRRDLVTLKNQYGSSSEVFTLATDDSFPQVWHYYVTYLSQFRAFIPPNPYPPERQNARTLQIGLNQAMQDPFIPGDALTSPRQLTLQLVESESRPRTLIRYIITPQPISTPIALQ